MSACEWCADPDADQVKRPQWLCAAHVAEHDGLSQGEVDRRGAETLDEWLATYSSISF